jgi:hypothetical protein
MFEDNRDLDQRRGAFVMNEFQKQALYQAAVKRAYIAL